MSIIVSGSLAYDKIMDFPGKFSDHIMPEKIHVLNVSFAVNSLRQNFGGTAGNIAYGLALLREAPIIMAAAGNDFSVYKEWLIKHKVDVSQIKQVADEVTACAHIITDQSDNQITGFHFGAMKFSAGPIKDSLLKKVKIAIVAPGNISDMADYSRLYQTAKLPYIFDPGQALTAISGDQLRSCISGAKVFIVNDYEMNMTINKTGWDKNEIKKRAEIVITTLGEKGSLIERGSEVINIPPAEPKNTSDPTGAGDAYRAGLIKGLILNLPLEKIGRLAATVAVYTVEQYGTQTHHFTWEELIARYENNFGKF